MYIALNFKGTKPLNMPRLSKPRGKGSEYRGISHRKVCIISAVDEYDNMFFDMLGLGSETTEMIDKCHGYFEIDEKKENYLVSDMKQIFNNLVKHTNKYHDEIKSGTYKSIKGNTLSDINQLHGEIRDKLKRYKGVSTRHLQGYLDFFSFTKKLKYQIENTNDKKQRCLVSAMKQAYQINRAKISTKKYPIDISGAYPESYRNQQVEKLTKQYLCLT